MSVILGPFPAYLQDRLPPIDSAAPNTYLPFAADLMERHTRNARHVRRHRLGLWNCPRCDPGSAAWFVAARALGQCAAKGGDDAARQSTINDCAEIDVSISVPAQVYVVF